MSVKLMGILNVTPDSFSDGGLYLDVDKAAAHAEQLFADGANIVDIGGAATNPWATQISATEELDRIEALAARLLPARPNYSYSIDTYQPEVVERLSHYGKFYVNDVTTFINPAMIAATAKHGLFAIASHLPLAANGDILAAHMLHMSDQLLVKQELLHHMDLMIQGGINPEHIILDPGIGFGKTPQLNWQLLNFWKHVTTPVLIGFSQKRFLEKDKISGDNVKNVSKLSDESNLEAAKILLTNYNQKSPDLLIRVHKPALYRNLLQSITI